jgi:hypothetical protein
VPCAGRETTQIGGFMAQRQRALLGAFAGAALIGSALVGMPTATADPTDPTTPVPVPLYPVEVPPPPVSNNPMTPRQPPVPAAPAPAPVAPPLGPPPASGAAPVDPPAPGAPPADAPPPRQTVPNTVPPPGSGKGGGILGSFMDIWRQARNPFAPTGGDIGGAGAPAPPPGAGPAPKLPPGYVSTNAPGSETPATSSGAGSGPRPALPPGYYPTSGPVPPWYLDPAAPPPAAAPTP